MTSISTFGRLRALAAMLALAALTGCASQMTHQDMTPAPIQLNKHHAQSVSVTALPALNANAEAAAAIMVELRGALSAAISDSKAFASVKPEVRTSPEVMEMDPILPSVPTVSKIFS